MQLQWPPRTTASHSCSSIADAAMVISDPIRNQCSGCDFFPGCTYYLVLHTQAPYSISRQTWSLCINSLFLLCNLMQQHHSVAWMLLKYYVVSNLRSNENSLRPVNSLRSSSTGNRINDWQTATATSDEWGYYPPNFAGHLLCVRLQARTFTLLLSHSFREHTVVQMGGRAGGGGGRERRTLMVAYENREFFSL